MENLPQLPTATDIESRAARIADPATPLRVKLDVACELREMIDCVRDAEATRVLPHMVSVLLDILRMGEPSFKKDSTEYQFRRVLVEIIYRVPYNDSMKPLTNTLMNVMLHMLRNDGEENGVTCLKTIIDIVRTLKNVADEHVVEFLAIFRTLLRSFPALVEEYLSEGSVVVDEKTVLPSSKSFKVMAESPVDIVLFFQSYKPLMQPTIQEMLPEVVSVVLIESPAQKKAREDMEAMGEYLAGAAPSMVNPTVYFDYVNSQIKLMSFLAYLTKSLQETFQPDSRGEDLVLACVRLLQDCPTHHTSGRRELLVLLRHQVGTANRRVLIPHLEKLFSEQVLLGPALASQEMLRPSAYGAMCDVVHQLKAELSVQQLIWITNVYSRLLHNPQLSTNVQTICAKMMFGMIDALLTKAMGKVPPEDVTPTLKEMIYSCANKMNALVTMQEDVLTRLERQKKGETVIDSSWIEKERPISTATHATENPEEVIKELRFFFRALLHGFRMCLGALKKCEAPVSDSEMVIQFFESAVRCMALFDVRDQREEREAMDWIAGILMEIDSHIFLELWTHKLTFFFDNVVKRASLLHITQMLFTHEVTSTPLTAVVLRQFSGDLESLGEQDDQTALATIRFFKMAFSAISLYSDANEPILATHLGRLIMDSFPLASKATRPINYFHLMRALFRAIGSGAGRFELLYHEVLPLLPDMLDGLSRMLAASDSTTHDLLVELCLTVPLRLTHLLPHLHYLMRPLVAALQGGPELVSQGLRTLELCIDNLTGEFLDPILRPVLRDLMEALHSHLKPVPANHHHAHTTIRILGKLGGRNRRLLDENLHLEYQHHSDPAKAFVTFSGRPEAVPINIGPMVKYAAQSLAKPNPSQPHHAYAFLEQSLAILLNEGLQGRDRETVFVHGLEGLFDAVHIQEIQEKALPYLLTLSEHIFTLEARRALTKDPASLRWASHTFNLYLDALPHALANPNPAAAKKAEEVVTTIIHNVVSIAHKSGLNSSDLFPMLHQIAGRFTSLCFDEQFSRRTAGCTGIKIMTSIPEIGEKWTSDRDIDLVRTLLHVLKDLPNDPPRNASEIIDILTHVLRITSTSHAAANGGTAPPKTILPLTSILVMDLTCAHPAVREAVQSCIKLLSELSGKSVVELLLPHRDRILGTIYIKPLRALPFHLQMGQIEAMRYLVSLQPPLLEVTDDLLRLLHETLGLAQLENNNDGRPQLRQAKIEANQLRIACIKLLTASMPLADFFSKHATTRSSITSTYLKSLYSTSKEVKAVAHEGLRNLLTQHSRLPRDLLQEGLRPILVNLGDPKKLTVSNLEGLASFLELLTNYFKVEIGVKLLGHYKIISMEPQTISQASRLPLLENENIVKLVQLVNIFHLLPPAANGFLSELVEAVVGTEAQLHLVAKSPFSEPLGKFFDRYPSESLDLFLRNLQMPAYNRTLRNVLCAKVAPALTREVASRSRDILDACLASGTPQAVLSTLHLFDDVAHLDDLWCQANPLIIGTLINWWRVDPPDVSAGMDLTERHRLLISIFIRTLETDPRIDIIFELMASYTKGTALDLVALTRFLYEHISINSSTTYRRSILLRFLTWFDDDSVPWPSKTYFIRYVVIPIILVHSSRSQSETLLDKDIISRFHDKIWRRMNELTAFGTADDKVRVELLHLTTVMVHRCPTLMHDVKKDIIKCAWTFIGSEDNVVKQTAYLLAARFFEAHESPAKFILSAWTGLLRPPHSEGRTLVRQALDILAPILQNKMPTEPGAPLWAKTTRRLLAEEGHGMSQIIIIYQLIIRQPDLFYPCRALFVPHMVNSLTKLGLHSSATPDSRLLSLEVLSVIFRWEQKASSEKSSTSTWITNFREGMVSYLIRLATNVYDPPIRNNIVPRSLSLLKDILGASGWDDVSVKLDYFRKALDQGDIAEATLAQANAAARVLNVVCVDKQDTWFMQNASILQKLIQKGMTAEDANLQDSLHPIFDRLIRLFPLPKEDDEMVGDMSEFHTFVNNAVNEGLRSSTFSRGTLLMLKSIAQVSPERIELFSIALMKLLNKQAKEHITTLPTAAGQEALVKSVISILEICQITVSFLADQRKLLIATLVALVEKSPSAELCRFLLEIGRDWAMHRRDAYPTMKEKASYLQKMAAFEVRGEALAKEYLELIYAIYTAPALRRSDLTSRLEHPFLLGCRAKDSSLREKFIDLLDNSIPLSLNNRLSYILQVQGWDALSDCNWIYLALDLLLSSVDGDESLCSNPSISFSQTSSSLAQMIQNSRMRDLIRPLRRLLFHDPQTAHGTWITLFPSIWSRLSRKEQNEVMYQMVGLLARESHIRQCELRPNVIQTLLEGVHLCSPPLALPPHLIKYLAKTFGAWHVSLELLQDSLDHGTSNDDAMRDMLYDSLAELYAELAEEDMFYGLWRRRAEHHDTVVALSYEQNGMWQEAQIVYENATNKMKNSLIPYSESENCLWEDHWMLAGEKLQQWDILCELARHEPNPELMLEGAWRTKDWSEKEVREYLEEQVKALPDIITPRRRVFEAFLCLIKSPALVEKNFDFIRILEDAMQLSLRKWIALPHRMSAAHIPLLQHFQQFVELQEAVQIFGSLASTTSQNLEKKSNDLKMVLQAWRDRLPNLHDDISVWSDLVAWRENVFTAINKHYIPLIPGSSGAGSNNNVNNTTYGYRGFHEIAWIINRFAHVARKHDLLDVSRASLKRIYELPNIEISEAFLKLREEARCHLQVPESLEQGLELINSTNMVYFSPGHKAEFLTMKGMFYARLNRSEDANRYFGEAASIEIAAPLPKAWAEWGRFNDKLFKPTSTDLSLAANAVSCYLQAAGIYKNGKSRPLLTRVLWLLSIDDSTFTISRAFDTYNGDIAYWYWITLIPQLCISLSHREAKQAKHILMNLAKHHPQALFYPLRTTKEELTYVKRQHAEATARIMQMKQNSSTATAPGQSSDGSANVVVKTPDPGTGEQNGQTTTSNGAQADTGALPPNLDGSSTPANHPAKHAWEHVDDVVAILKTAYPLLTLTLETMVDQINQRFRATSEEEIYRYTFMLLQDGVSSYGYRSHSTNDDGRLLDQTIKNIQRLAQNLAGQARKDYEEDFIHSKPNLADYIRRLQHWRDRYEKFLDTRPRLQPLDLLSHWLTEFQYTKTDEVEVPGQYLEHIDSNQRFSRIQQFGPRFELCRGQGYCYKRFVIHGHDGSKHTFAVQLPTARWCRREERVMQVFRTFSAALTRRKESRKRNLHFHIPAAVPVSSGLRLVSGDSSYISLQDIYDQHCEEVGIAREDPIIIAGDKTKAVLRELFREVPSAVGHHFINLQEIFLPCAQPSKVEMLNLKKNVVDEVIVKMIPDDVLIRYMTRTMSGPSDLWRIRKQFTSQLASISFMTYILCMSSRQPARIHISRVTGQIYMSEILPGLNNAYPVFNTGESVPFRLTPNLQRFVGPVGTEGILTSGIVSIARALTTPEFELDQQLCLFARDEVLTWMHSKGKPLGVIDVHFRRNVEMNIDGVVKKAELMSCKLERSQEIKDADKPSPVMQTVANLISMATNPIKLAAMPDLYSPWF